MSIAPTREDQAFGAGYRQASNSAGMIIEHLTARLRQVEKERDDARALVEQLQAKVDGTKAGRDFHIGTASELLALLADIIDAENDFRESMGVNWEGDPLSDAIEAARRFIKLETPALSSTERRGSE